MYWIDGEIVEAPTLTLSVDDRLFEHGLGLFETFRTWDGFAPLLGRHLSRMLNSAKTLGLVIEPGSLPKQRAIRALLNAGDCDLDARIRLTASGGEGPRGVAKVWMRVSPLDLKSQSRHLEIAPCRVSALDGLAQHKNLNYWNRRLAFEHAKQRGLADALMVSEFLQVWEGSRTNVFAKIGSTLTTPSTDGPLVPGVFRSLVIETALALGMTVDEPLGIPMEDLSRATEVFLTNSVRGIIPISDYQGRHWDAPGELTAMLQATLAERIKIATRLRSEL